MAWCFHLGDIEDFKSGRKELVTLVNNVPPLQITVLDKEE
jgi:hypothetical protein